MVDSLLPQQVRRGISWHGPLVAGRRWRRLLGRQAASRAVKEAGRVAGEETRGDVSPEPTAARLPNRLADLCQDCRTARAKARCVARPVGRVACADTAELVGAEVWLARAWSRNSRVVSGRNRTAPSQHTNRAPPGCGLPKARELPPASAPHRPAPRPSTQQPACEIPTELVLDVCRDGPLPLTRWPARTASGATGSGARHGGG
jgi:hypothetical protein